MKKATTKPAAKSGTPRKAQAKKANAPMKNKPAAKSPKAAVKSAASKAAKTMAKTASPANRKSAAKRVERVEKKSGLAVAKAQMSRMTKILREDCAAACGGKGDEKQFIELVQAVTRAVKNCKKKHGIEIE